MSVGFGFSVGDFLDTLKLVGTVIDALRESSHSTSAFQELLNELEALKTALNHVKRIDLDSSQNFERIALHQAAAQCQRSIATFWNKVQKYQAHLSKGGTNSRVKDGWSKIKWAVCKRRDVDTFRAEIQGHTSSIQVLIDAIQLDATTRLARDQKTQYKSLAGKIQEFSFQALGKLCTIANDTAKAAQHSTKLLQTCAEILQTNLRVFQTVYDIQLFITRLPGQVQRQQPVYLIDAFNKESPFHLEFVRSADALLAVLKINFRDAGCEPEMIDRGEFVIEELGTQRAIDITQNWETCFFPGQKIAMSMTFRNMKDSLIDNLCPRCQYSNNGSRDKEVTCHQCGTVYRRIEEVEDAHQQLENAVDQADNLEDNNQSRGRSRERRAEKSLGRDDHESILKFRRLRILTGGLQHWRDRIPRYRLDRFSLQKFLTRTFGDFNFSVKVDGDYYHFSVPRLLTNEEKTDLAYYRWDENDESDDESDDE